MGQRKQTGGDRPGRTPEPRDVGAAAGGDGPPTRAPRRATRIYRRLLGRSATIINTSTAVVLTVLGIAMFQLERRTTALELERHRLDALKEGQLARIHYVGQFTPGESLRMVSTNDRHVLETIDLTIPYELTRHFMFLKYGTDSISRSIWSNEYVERIEENAFWLRYGELHRFLLTLVPRDGSIDGIPSRVPFAVVTGFYDNNTRKRECGRYWISYDNFVTPRQPMALSSPRLEYVGPCGADDADRRFVDSIWWEERRAKGHTRSVGGIRETVVRTGR